MVNTTIDHAARPASPKAHLEDALQARIETLSYLPTSANVALKFIELGRDPESSPQNYATVISSDASLSSKLLSLVNSSWFGVRQHVTKIPVAVSLLGLCNVRSLALSYCMTGLHNELGLSREDSLTYWEAGLCKAVTARRYIQLARPDLADVAFAAGIFQDFALTIMHVLDGGQTAQMLADPNFSLTERLANERARFGMDHCEAGRLLAQKLELPEFYVDAIAFHHDLEGIRKYAEDEILANGVFLAGTMPHIGVLWQKDDIEQAKRLLCAEPHPCSEDWETFLEHVQKELNEAFAYFQDGAIPDLKLKQMLVEATKEMADATTCLVGQVHQLMAGAANTGHFVHNILIEKKAIEDKSRQDTLTRELNREGFIAKATEALDRAKRYGSSVAVTFIDIDRFKSVNDANSHAFGDYVLLETAARIRAALGDSAILSRLGGDEFVALLRDISEEQARTKLADTRTQISRIPFAKGKVRLAVTASAGMLWTAAVTPDTKLEKLMTGADQAMYEAKQAGRNQTAFRVA